MLSNDRITKFIKKISIVCIATSSLIILSGSGHFESDLSRSYPQFDILDSYVFGATSKGNTAFVMTINPAAASDATDVFGTKGLYNFHIATDDGLSKGMTFTVQFTGDHVELAKLDTANGTLGAKGKVIGSGPSGKTLTLPSGVKLWTGVVKDPFFGNAAGIQAFVPALIKGTFSRKVYNNAEDFFKGNTVGALVLELPNDMLGNQIHFYTSTALHAGKKWIQINRSANVLMTHLLLLGDPKAVEKLNASRPGKDKSVLTAITKDILTATTLAGSQTDPKAYAKKTAEALFPDVLTYQVGTPASYTPYARNGRRLSDDGMNTALSLISGTAMDDEVDTSHHYQSTFPYVLPQSE